MKTLIVKIAVILFSVSTIFTQNSIPNGAQFSKQYVELENIPIDWTSVVGWLQAVSLDPSLNNKTGVITIDYMRLYEYDRNTNKPRLIFEENYNNREIGPLEDYEGRLFPRYPRWYSDNAEGIENYMFNSNIKNGKLIIDASKTTDRICHWWTPQQQARDNCDYYMEVSAKIEGNVGLQVGSDWWQSVGATWCGDQKCNKLAWVSDWYGDTHGEFVLLTAPLK